MTSYRTPFHARLARALPSLAPLTLAVVASTVALPAFAGPSEALYSARNEAWFSVGGQALNYWEKDSQGLTTDGTLDGEKGDQPAVQLGFSKTFNAFGVSDWWVQDSLSVAYGHTNYTGYHEDVTHQGDVFLTPLRANTRNLTTDVSVKLGKVFHVAPRVDLTPYLGYSYHLWYRSIRAEGGTTSEVYTHHLLGAGLLSQWAATDRLVLSADASVGTTLGAQVRTGVGTMGLHARPQEQLILGVDYALTQRLHATASYSVMHTSYGQSGVVNGYFEPSSSTTAQQAMVGLAYAF